MPPSLPLSLTLSFSLSLINTRTRHTGRLVLSATHTNTQTHRCARTHTRRAGSQSYTKACARPEPPAVSSPLSCGTDRHRAEGSPPLELSAAPPLLHRLSLRPPLPYLTPPPQAPGPQQPSFSSLHLSGAPLLETPGFFNQVQKTE